MEEKAAVPLVMEFIGTPAIDDYIKMKISNSVYWISGVGIFFIFIVLFSTIMVISEDAGGFTDPGNLLCLLFAVPLTMGYLIGLMGVFAGLLWISKFTQGKKWDDKRELVISIEGDHILIKEDVIFRKRENRIPLDQITGCSREVIPYLTSIGIKLPIYYKPIVQAAPPSISHSSLLYLSRDYPMDYLVRLDMAKGVPINCSAGGKMKMIEGKYQIEWIQRSKRTVIIPIRPVDQSLFMKIMKNEIAHNN